jgi:hypothetical protein
MILHIWYLWFPSGMISILIFVHISKNYIARQFNLGLKRPTPPSRCVFSMYNMGKSIQKKYFNKRLGHFLNWKPLFPDNYHPIPKQQAPKIKKSVKRQNLIAETFLGDKPTNFLDYHIRFNWRPPLFLSRQKSFPVVHDFTAWYSLTSAKSYFNYTTKKVIHFCTMWSRNHFSRNDLDGLPSSVSYPKSNSTSKLGVLIFIIM